MALYTTYGYINLAKNIYDLKAFRKSNDKAIKTINAIIQFNNYIITIYRQKDNHYHYILYLIISITSL